MISNELLSYFEQSANAVFVADAEKIEYCNSAARRLFPHICEKSDVSLLNQGVTVGDKPCVISASLCSRQVNISVLPLGGSAVYTVYIREGDSADDIYLRPALRVMRDALSTMKISGDLIAQHIDSGDDERTAKYMATMAHSYYKMARIVGGLSNIEGCRAESRNVRCFDLARLCYELCDTVSAVTADRGTKLTYNGDTSGVLFEGDAVELERLLLNLLSNSFKYTPEDGEITVRLAAVGGRLLLSVSDTGCGMADEVLSSVLNGGFAPKAGVDPRRGVGAGVGIVRKIAEKHGGSLFIESREGEGTKAVISLPANTGNGRELHTPVSEYEAYGMGTILTELADILGYEAYMPRFAD